MSQSITPIQHVSRAYKIPPLRTNKVHINVTSLTHLTILPAEIKGAKMQKQSLAPNLKELTWRKGRKVLWEQKTCTDRIHQVERWEEGYQQAREQHKVMSTEQTDRLYLSDKYSRVRRARKHRHEIVVVTARKAAGIWIAEGPKCRDQVFGLYLRGTQRTDTK